MLMKSVKLDEKELLTIYNVANIELLWVTDIED